MALSLFLKFNTQILPIGMIGVAHNVQRGTLVLYILDQEAGVDLNMLRDGVLMSQLKLFIILLLWEIPDRMQQF